MKKRIAAFLMAVVFVLTSAITNGTVTANAENDTNLRLEDDTLQTVQMAAGTKLHMKMELSLKEGWCSSPAFEVVPTDSSSPLTINNVKITNKEYPENPYVFITNTTSAILEYDITIDDYAKIGTYGYYITYTGETGDDEEQTPAAPGRLQMKVVVVAEKTPPQIAVISNTEFSAKAGEEVELKFTIRNEGEIKALNTYISVGYNNAYMIPTYTPLDQKVGDLVKGATREVTVSYTISKDAPTERVRLPINVTYKNQQGESFTTDQYALYLNIEGKQAEQPEAATVVLNTVKQSPAAPKAGENLKVTFSLQNLGKADATDVKVSATGLSSNGFEPINSEPYQYVGSIGAGSSKQVEVTVKVGENISAGLNTLNIQYSYTDATGKVTTESVPLNILNVQNNKDEDTTISRPKLMISDFYTDIEEVKAGNVFDFTFELLNTNDEIAAKNIKAIVTSSDGTFSVTAGGNSFFVKEIKPGETAKITINLKASAAATTKACPINIRMEYEYEGMVTSANYTGEVVEETLLLQVKENLRPSVENVYIANWSNPTVNQPVALNFEFYNMGKSTLNNAYVTIEGDFMLSNGSNSYYIGNISAGMPEYVEFDVVPLVEGNAVGKMIIHMEDSNGEEVLLEKEFSSYISGEQQWIDPGIEDPSVPADVTPVDVKKPIVPLWVFLCIQAGILVVIIPVTRKLFLIAYRRKIRKEDEI